jgi:hypothetical protein
VTPLDWINAFALFAKLGADVVEAFKAEHPELSDPPPEDTEARIWDDFDQAVADKFGHGSQPPDTLPSPPGSDPYPDDNEP